MDAFFIGHSYTDVTFITDRIPEGDERSEGVAHGFSVGGNAVSASFCAARLGIDVGLMTQVAPDRLGDTFLDRAEKEGIKLYARPVKSSSLSVILPNEDKRAIMSTKDTDYLDERFPEVDISGCAILHVDGHMMDAAIHYAKECREKGILTSLDGGALREGVKELLEYIDIAVVSEDFAEKLKMSKEETLHYLHSKGVKVAAVTFGAKGVYFSESSVGVASVIQHVPAIYVHPDKIVDTVGAGDIFHGAYVYSVTKNPSKTWAQHFEFAGAASALCIQKMGSERAAPTLDMVEALLRSQSNGHKFVSVIKSFFKRR